MWDLETLLETLCIATVTSPLHSSNKPPLRASELTASPLETPVYSLDLEHTPCSFVFP
jgi:hypothetical protein